MRLLALTFCAAACAQSIEAPLLGTMLAADGTLRALHGLAGNFTLGERTVAADPPPPLLVERRDGQVLLLDAHGLIVDALPHATGPVLPLDGAIVYVSGDDLVLRRADHSELRHSLPGIALLRRIGPDYVQANGHALRLSTGALYLLPQPPPATRRR